MNIKKVVVLAIVIIIVAIVITVCFKSCQGDKKEESELLNLLPSSQEAEVSVNTPLIVEQIQQLGRLETVDINLQQVFSSNRNQDTLWGAFGEKATYMAYCRIIAGIDLSILKETDILIDGENVEINLPSAEIFSIYLTQDSYMVSREKGLFASFDFQLENQIRQEALMYFEGQANSLKVLKIAQENAQNNIKDLLNKLGFKNVNFKADVEVILN